MPRQMWTLTQSDASFLVDRAIEAAAGMGVRVTVVVVEASGVPLALLRMDDTKPASVHVAQAKAWTAALFQRPSGDYGPTTAPGAIAYGLPNAFPGWMVPLIGGQPIVAAGVCIGGIGVSGATGEQDDGIAQAATAAFAQRAVA
ncbi:MAG TPA: heme-binding protein [Ramlibacter sp.]|uniref:GlcG/HbpS family heme-binding protein n=1 Tax=Ramlibacter sp. TaxID=1917967 RepID=UPI002BC926BA|nr:heme-binding protein [Ramlibacter sp.]HVZ45724.1 heme-binding protein [Ramlibacter sp.]